MDVFKNKNEYIQWKNSDEAPYKHSHIIEESATFDYWIAGVNQLFEMSEVEQRENWSKYKVKESLGFAYAIFKKGVDIDNTIFVDSFMLCNNCEFYNRFLFMNNEFEKQFDLSNALFENNNCVPVQIQSCHFKGIANFEGIESRREILIRNCEFDRKVLFCNCSLDQNITIENCKFKDEIDFTGTSFNKKLYFVNNEVLGDLIFSNCTFNDTAKIVDIKCESEKVLFNLATIKGMLQFNGWINKMDLKLNSEVSFNHAFIEPTGYVIIRNINDETSSHTGSFNFSCANIIGHVVMSEVYAEKLNLESSSIIGSFNTQKIFFDKDLNRETYVRLKNEAVKRNDSIMALCYKAKEMVSYKKELDDKSHKLTTDKILLWLNTISNKNGQSWWRGFLFTTITAALFFWIINYLGISGSQKLFVLDWRFSGCDDVWKRYLNMFYLIDFKDKFANIELNALGETVFLISKIFIGYGIYQTISAFRKYGK